jgi:hypothetical protein
MPHNNTSIRTAHRWNMADACDATGRQSRFASILRIQSSGRGRSLATRALSGFGFAVSGAYFRHGQSQRRHFPTRRAIFHSCCWAECWQWRQTRISGVRSEDHDHRRKRSVPLCSHEDYAPPKETDLDIGFLIHAVVPYQPFRISPGRGSASVKNNTQTDEGGG